MKESDLSLVMSTTEEVIAEAFNGHAFVLVDDADSENGSDVIIPAQFATPKKINFKAKYAHGLICPAVSGERTHTITVAIDQSHHTRDIVSPSHVFLLVAKEQRARRLWSRSGRQTTDPIGI